MDDSQSAAQAHHDQRRAEDPTHDQIACWCCCLDCNPED